MKHVRALHSPANKFQASATLCYHVLPLLFQLKERRTSPLSSPVDASNEDSNESESTESDERKEDETKLPPNPTSEASEND